MVHLGIKISNKYIVKHSNFLKSFLFKESLSICLCTSIHKTINFAFMNVKLSQKYK